MCKWCNRQMKLSSNEDEDCTEVRVTACWADELNHSSAHYTSRSFHWWVLSHREITKAKGELWRTRERIMETSSQTKKHTLFRQMYRKKTWESRPRSGRVTCTSTCTRNISFLASGWCFFLCIYFGAQECNRDWSVLLISPGCRSCQCV